MENQDINLTWEQRAWLDQHGGRLISDARKDEKGIYTLMGNGRGGDIKVYLPSEETKK